MSPTPPLIDGNLIKSWGFLPGPVFKTALEKARLLAVRGLSLEEIRLVVEELKPKVDMTPKLTMRERHNPVAFAIAATCMEDEDNITKCWGLMHALLCVPVVKRGALMPDACPAGMQPATIPVGGVIEVDNAIIPGAHSADICCSMFVTFHALPPQLNVPALMDIVHSVAHFGPGGRDRNDEVKHPITDAEHFATNPFLIGLRSIATSHTQTAGDGNHMVYMGLHTSPEGITSLALVSHFGSRGLGAALYKRGMEVAIRQTAAIATDIPEAAAWIDYDTQEGKDYWAALKYIERWTHANHETLHAAFAKAAALPVVSTFWNPHNFVFKKGRSFYHAKGATPLLDYEEPYKRSRYSLIPLNMAEPILIVEGEGNDAYLGHAPHGAGRNASRTATLKAYAGREEETLRESTRGIEVRWFFGKPDLSESPVGYKSARQIEAQIERFNLAKVVGRITPLGSLMAGELPEPHWKKVKRERKAAASPNTQGGV